MPLIDAGELARIQADFAACFDATAVIQTYSQVSDGAGGRTETWTSGATVAARIAPLTGGETQRRGTTSSSGRIDPRTTHVVSVPAGTAVTAKDRVLLGGQVYEITAVRTRTDEVIRRLEVMTT